MADTIHPQVRGTVTSCYLEVFAVYARPPLLDVAGPGVGALGWTHASGRLSLRITVAQRGVLRRSRPYHRWSVESMAGS